MQTLKVYSTNLWKKIWKNWLQIRDQKEVVYTEKCHKSPMH